jgi:hypothetical protein
MKEASMDDVIKYLKALLIMQVHGSGGETGPKPEVLLASAGLSNTEIAVVLRKNQAAVAKALSRAKKR